MEFLIRPLVSVIVIEFLYILYQDYTNRKERQKLSLLLKSGSVAEFQAVVKPLKEKKTDSKPGSQSIREDHVPIENIIDEVPFEKLMEAKDNF